MAGIRGVRVSQLWQDWDDNEWWTGQRVCWTRRCQEFERGPFERETCEGSQPRPLTSHSPVTGSLKTTRQPVSSSHLILYPPLSSSQSAKMFWMSLVLSSLLKPVKERIFVLLTACCPGRIPLIPGADGGGTVPWPWPGPWPASGEDV